MPSSENPFESPSPRGTRLVQATLRVIVAIQCWGYAAFRLHHRGDYALTEVFGSSYELSTEHLNQFNDYTAYFLVGCGLLTLFRPTWLLLLPLTIWQVGMAAAPVLSGHGAVPELVPVEHATRYIAPLALLLVDLWPPRVKPSLAFCLTAIGFLRMATTATFIGHGLMALYQAQQGGNFIELITLSMNNVFNFEVSESLARSSLGVIGALDIAVGISLISSRNRMIAFWMVLWGLATAASRTFAYGIDGYDQTLIRVANSGAPLTVLMFWILAIREVKPTILPEKSAKP